MEGGVVFLQFGAYEREKIVAVEERFGAFGEVLLVVGQSVMAHAFSGVEQDVRVEVTLFGLLECGDDAWFFERQDLVVIRVGEFMQDDGRVLEHLPAREQVFCNGDMDVASEARVVSVGGQPAFGRVILHVAQAGVVFLDPDGEGAQLGEAFAGHEDADALEMVCEHLEGLSAFVVVLHVQKAWVDANGPSFDRFFDGVEAW